jgi:uroporphyrinogen-III decarboxylase
MMTQSGHPIKYPVDSLEAVRIYREMWEGATFKGYDDTATLKAINTLIDDDGVVTRFWGPSAIPMLLEEDMGIENFYYLMADDPEEIDGLIRTIHKKHLQAFEHLANGPWDSVTLIENTSTFYISPDIYKQYNMPHQRDFVEAIKRKGKTAILHMCGHVNLLLDLIKETGCDGIHALTPAPTGDTPWEKAMDVLGDDLIIIGALDPSIFVSGPVNDIGPALDQLITPRLKEGNFVLCPFADGIPVALERFEALKHWIEDNS